MTALALINLLTNVGRQLNDLEVEAYAQGETDDPARWVKHERRINDARIAVLDAIREACEPTEDDA